MCLLLSASFVDSSPMATCDQMRRTQASPFNLHFQREREREKQNILHTHHSYTRNLSRGRTAGEGSFLQATQLCIHWSLDSLPLSLILLLPRPRCRLSLMNFQFKKPTHHRQIFTTLLFATLFLHPCIASQVSSLSFSLTSCYIQLLLLLLLLLPVI